MLWLAKDSLVRGSDKNEGNSSVGSLARSSGGTCGSMLGVPVEGKRVERGGSEKGSANEVGSFEIGAIVGVVHGGHQQ